MYLCRCLHADRPSSPTEPITTQPRLTFHPSSDRVAKRRDSHKTASRLSFSHGTIYPLPMGDKTVRTRQVGALTQTFPRSLVWMVVMLYISLPLALWATCLCYTAPSIAGSLADIDHVVLFMQENRAFDHVTHSLSISLIP